MKYDTNTLIDTAMQIIKDENTFFVKEGIANSEHIPRIIRIAESAGKLLSVSGMSKIDADGNIERIIQFGRQLFVDEWMKPFDGESEPPCEEDAIDEFNLYLTKKKKSSNKRLKPPGAMGKRQGE